MSKRISAVLFIGVSGLISLSQASAQKAAKYDGKFQLEEATISQVHAAIKSGQITCQGLVEDYVKRARA
jgi:amidase